MRTEVDGIDVGMLMPQHGFHGGVDFIQFFQRAEVTGYDGLVGHNNCEEVAAIDEADSLARTFDEPQLVGPVQQAYLLSDGAVAVEENGRTEIPAVSPCHGAVFYVGTYGVIPVGGAHVFDVLERYISI